MREIDPGECLEIMDPADYDANYDKFAAAGLGSVVFQAIARYIEQCAGSTLALWRLAKAAELWATTADREPRIVEIGSGRGGSIITIGMAATRARLTNIDPFQPYDETSVYGTVVGYKGFTRQYFDENVSHFPEVKARLTTLQKTSDEAVGDIVTADCDLVFVDGNHSLEPTMADIRNYQHKVRPGGILCGHDYHARFPGVVQAVDTLLPDAIVLPCSSVWAVIVGPCDGPTAAEFVPELKGQPWP